MCKIIKYVCVCSKKEHTAECHAENQSPTTGQYKITNYSAALQKTFARTTGRNQGIDMRLMPTLCCSQPT